MVFQKLLRRNCQFVRQADYFPFIVEKVELQ